MDHKTNTWQQMVMIYGFNYNDFHWINQDQGIICQTTGTIIENPQTKKTYILTARSNLLSCKTIVAHYCLHDKKSNVYIYRQFLRPVFQLPQYNIIIFDFDHTNSELIHDANKFSPQIVPLKFEYVAVTNSNYHIHIIDLDLTGDNLRFDIHIHEVNFKDSFTKHHDYLPSFIMFNFSLEIKDSDLTGILIYDDNQKIIGMIQENNSVLPAKYIDIFLFGFFQYVDNVNQYMGPLEYPIGLSSLIQTTKGQRHIKKDDQIISIDNKKIELGMVYDDYFKRMIKIKQYFKINLRGNPPAEDRGVNPTRGNPSAKDLRVNPTRGNPSAEDRGVNPTRGNFSFVHSCEVNPTRGSSSVSPKGGTMQIELLRGDQIIKMDIYGKKMLQVSDHPYYFEKDDIICAIPYINFNGFILTKTTPELLMLAKRNGMELPHKLDKIVIMSCVDENFAKKYDFGYSYCGTVRKINDNKVPEFCKIANMKFIKMTIRTNDNKIMEIS